MNLAQLVQSQNFATLLQALGVTGELTAGRTVQARLLALEPDGTATALIGDSKVALVLAGPEAKQATLQPGATLLLRLDPPERPGGDLRATLVEVRPPATAPSSPPSPQQPAPSSPSTRPDVPAPAGGPAMRPLPTIPGIIPAAVPAAAPQPSAAGALTAADRP
ncbi:hypothetical protein ACIPIA_15605, partial [Bosea sp. CER48]